MKKFLISMIITMGVLGISRVGASSGHEYTRFLQTDTRWSDYVYDESGLNLNDAGCLITSVTMLMGYANTDLRDTDTWNPEIASKKFEFNGNGSLFWHSPEKFDSTFRFLGKYHEGSKLDKDYVTDLIVDLMNEGYYVIVRVNGIHKEGIAHYSPIVGVLDGKPILWDVGTGERDTYSKWADFGIDEVCVYESSLNKSYNVMLSDRLVSNFKSKSLKGISRISIQPLKIGRWFRW